MTLLDPKGTKIQFYRRRRWRTNEQIARGCGISESAVENAFNGRRIWAQTAEAMARELEVDVEVIAAFVPR